MKQKVVVLILGVFVIISLIGTSSLYSSIGKYVIMLDLVQQDNGDTLQPILDSISVVLMMVDMSALQSQDWQKNYQVICIEHMTFQKMQMLLPMHFGLAWERLYI